MTLQPIENITPLDASRLYLYGALNGVVAAGALAVKLIWPESGFAYLFLGISAYLSLSLYMAFSAPQSLGLRPFERKLIKLPLFVAPFAIWTLYDMGFYNISTVGTTLGVFAFFGWLASVLIWIMEWTVRVEKRKKAKQSGESA